MGADFWLPELGASARGGSVTLMLVGMLFISCMVPGRICPMCMPWFMPFCMPFMCIWFMPGFMLLFI